MDPSAMECRAGIELICITSEFFCTADENNNEALPLRMPKMPCKAMIIEEIGAILAACWGDVEAVDDAVVGR